MFSGRCGGGRRGGDAFQSWLRECPYHSQLFHRGLPKVGHTVGRTELTGARRWVVERWMVGQLVVG